MMDTAQAYIPPALDTGRSWGFSLNLYALRSRRNWGVGDFTDLRTFVRFAVDMGAGIVGLNPLHALHSSNPEAASPYSPTSRYFINPIYLDIEAVPEFASPSPRAQRLRTRVAAKPFASALTLLREEPAVAYTRVARAKWSALDELYGILRDERSERTAALAAFIREGGTRLERFAIYEALTEHFERTGGGQGWLTWPEAFRDARSEAVRTWAAAHRRRIDYFKYVQWIAREQLALAAADARALQIGLYLDVAVGVDHNSADVWNEPDAYLLDRCVGAPPDPLGPLGQNWGLVAPDPLATDRDGGAAFNELLASNMAHAGALRLDHVMALRRLFLIPIGQTPAEGEYVAYPFERLLALAAAQSERARCLIVGEDLGTVPDGFRDRLQRAAIFSYRVFLFEREEDGSFKAPDAYPALGLATATTHDLPSLAAWASGTDLDFWERLGTMPEGWAADARTERRLDVARMLEALRTAGELDQAEFDASRAAIDERSSERARFEPLVRAVYRYLASTPARLVLVALDDALAEFSPVNVPGTGFEYPNWRRKNAVLLEDIVRDQSIATLAAEVRIRMGHPAPAPTPAAPTLHGASAPLGAIGGHAAPIIQHGASAPLGAIGGHAAPIIQHGASAPLGAIGGHAAPISE
jgi:4-alpha-glucanotransferase